MTAWFTECEECGTETANMDAHREVCPARRERLVASRESCPMCGEAYDEWLTHLRECDARGTADPRSDS